MLGSYETTIGGSTGIDGSLDYKLLVTVPAKGVSQQVNALAKQFLKTDANLSSNYIFDIELSGDYDAPIFKLKNVMNASGVSSEQMVKQKVEEETAVKKEELEAELKKEMYKAEDSLKSVINEALQKGEAEIDSLIANQKDSVTKEVLKKLGLEQQADSAKSDVKKKAKNVLEGLLKRKKKNKQDTTTIN